MILRRAIQALRGWALNPRLPVRTVRTRLTLLYGALFLVSGAALLAIAYTLTWNATKPPGTTRGHIIRHPGNQRPAHTLREPKPDLLASQHATVMHQLLISCVIALAITAVLSIALGWIVAGRVLRPLRTMTAATQRISDQNLHQRLAVAGPADELKQLGDTIDDLLARLETAFDAQRRFVANASHELRTPLTMMRTALDVATRKPGPPAPGVTALAGKIRAGLDKADRLVESFLTLARAQHGGTIRTSTVALDQLAATVLAEHSAAVSDLRLTVEQDHQHAPVPGNQPLLTHLAGNLIGNAIRHNQPGGWIRVATATGAGTGTARLIVENTGPVLDPDRVGELLQPFRRAAPDRTGPGGTGAGLGLSIVAAIVATHHGT
ncbi:MAG: HAMP domain-containing protein, partial [Actinobacteria bacterium]|nr:HAMP domain-containing protein [Actinomycetota bacterium]